MNARRNVPSVEGAATLPSSADRRPERSTSQSSMLSAPSTIAKIGVITLRPALAAPTRSPRRTHRAANDSIPSRAGERRDQHDPGVRHRPPIVKDHLHAIQSERPVILHHEDDLLTQDATAPIGRFPPAQEVILRSRPDGSPASAGGSRLRHRRNARRGALRT
jgi:hypothetical protein